MRKLKQNIVTVTNPDGAQSQIGDRQVERVVQQTFTIKITPNEMLRLRERYILDYDIEVGYENTISEDQLMAYNIQEWYASGDHFGQILLDDTATYTLEEWNQGLEEVVTEAIKLGKELHKDDHTYGAGWSSDAQIIAYAVEHSARKELDVRQSRNESQS